MASRRIDGWGDGGSLYTQSSNFPALLLLLIRSGTKVVSGSLNQLRSYGQYVPFDSVGFRCARKILQTPLQWEVVLRFLRRGRRRVE
jgi:hypothetical protein